MSLIPSGINIGAIAGPPFVAVIINWGLFGVLSTQVYLYFQTFRNDKLLLQGLVLGVYLLEMAQTFMLAQTVWNMLITGFGNIKGMDEIGTAWLSVCLIGGVVALLVQCFYAYRVAVISQKRIIPGIIIFISLISFGGALAASINTKKEQLYSKLLLNKSETFTALALWGASSSACDSMIAICMWYYLRQRTRQSRKFSRTEALVSKLIRMTIETGALTASVSTLSLALYYAPNLTQTSYFEVPLSAQAKCYSTTMLAVLNSRRMLGIVSESVTWRDNELTATSPLPRSRDPEAFRLNIAPTSSHSQNTQVFITKEEVITTDDPKVKNNNYPDTPDTPEP